MKGAFWLRVALVVLLIGAFPDQCHALVNMAADIWTIAAGIIRSSGVNATQENVEAVVTLVGIAIVVLVVSSAVGKSLKGGRRA
jgi:hypothetical protein